MELDLGGLKKKGMAHNFRLVLNSVICSTKQVPKDLTAAHSQRVREAVRDVRGLYTSLLYWYVVL